MRVIKWLDDHLEETILLLLLICMTLLMGVQICARYIFNNSLTWSEELTRYLFIWSGFISIPYCIKKWISIKVDQIINLLPESLYVVFQLILNLILTIFFVYLSVHAFTFLQMSFASEQHSAALKLPMVYVHAAPLCGFTLASIRSFQQIVIEVQNVLHLLRHEPITTGKGR